MKAEKYFIYKNKTHITCYVILDHYHYIQTYEINDEVVWCLPETIEKKNILEFNNNGILILDNYNI